MPDTFRCLIAAALIGLGVPALAGEGQLPLLRTPVLEPTLMGPATVADTFAHDQSGAENIPWQTGGFFHAEAPFTEATFIVWANLDGSESFWFPIFFHVPDEAIGKAVGTTFLGPESGTGDKTWPATAYPDDIAIPGSGSRGVIAYNLTCSAEATLDGGAVTFSNTHAAGEHNGRMLDIDPAKPLTLTTTGTWTIEAAVPKRVRCFLTEGIGASSGTGGIPSLLASQWGMTTVKVAVTNQVATIRARAYYPDGCRVDEEDATVTFPLYGADALPAPATVFPFLCTRIQTDKDVTYRLWGGKGFRRLLSDAELQTIRARDAAEMARRGLIPESELTHDEHSLFPTATTTLSARATAKPRHNPGKAPPSPPFATQEETP